MSAACFTAAEPVWAAGLSGELHVFAGFRVRLPAMGEGWTLRIAAASLYRAWVDGVFVGHGPARAAHGFARIDEWAMGSVAEGAVLAVEVVGYGINSYYVVGQAPFVQAEAITAGKAVVATRAGDGAWEAAALPQKRLRVQRYSWMRTFLEMYDLDERTNGWRTGGEFAAATRSIESAARRGLLPRRTSLPAFEVARPTGCSATGTGRPCALPAVPWRDRSLANVGPHCLGYREEELEEVPSLDLQRWAFAVDRERRLGALPAAIGGREFAVLDFGINLSGFIGLRATARRPTRAYLVFDEVATESGDVDFKRWSSANVVALTLAPGRHEFETMEPYALRFLKVFAAEGELELEAAYLREYANPDAPMGALRFGDARLDGLFEAGRQTFRQNAVDTFMDCPGRERGAYLCDSFFAARAAFVLTGTTKVEHDFLENFLLAPDPLGPLPEGMVPMCYPADHPDGLYIPNWGMWLFVQLEEFAGRGGDGEIVRGFGTKAAKLAEIFAGSENERGLLEDLPGWVFVEWSAANDWTAGINFPTNMLYAGFLSSAGRLYGRGDWLAKAERVRDTVRELSFDGEFFADQAVRRGGCIERTGNRSEACQYFACFFGAAAGPRFDGLRETLARDFGPRRDAERVHPSVKRANAFIGNVLRLEVLSASGRGEQAVAEALELYGPQAAATGTLWEFDTTLASCNHGFGAHVCWLLARDGKAEG